MQVTPLLLAVPADRIYADSPKNGFEESDDETTASRFIGRLVRCLLKGFEAKDKNVRYRVLQIVAEVLSALETIEWVEYPMNTDVF